MSVRRSMSLDPLRSLPNLPFETFQSDTLVGQAKLAAKCMRAGHVRPKDRELPCDSYESSVHAFHRNMRDAESTAGRSLCKFPHSFESKLALEAL